MNIFPRPRLFFVSPWLLAAATALLVLIVVTFTMTNIRREEQLMTNAMLQKADTLIRVVHSGSRSAYFADLQRGVWEVVPWSEYVQQVISHIAEDPDVAFLAVVDDTSRVIAHNEQGKIGHNLDFVLPKTPPRGKADRPPIGFRIAKNGTAGRVFEAVRVFYPYQSILDSIPHNLFGRGPGRHAVGQDSVLYGMFMPSNVPVPPPDERNYYVLVGLDMSSYDRSLRRIKLQTFLLSLIMLLVGLGGWLSLAAVQGYRVSQKTLGEMKLFTGLLLAKLPVGIIAADRSGTITTFNESAVEMTGVSHAQALGAKTSEVMPAQLAEMFPPVEQEPGREHYVGQEREVKVAVQGRNRHFLCHLVAFDGGESARQGCVLLVSDLTQLKSLEREMRENERLAAVGRMAAGVAHEVRNPLSSIKGLALLLKGKFAEKSSESEAAGLLVDQVERMNRTVSELLSFARPAPLNLEKVDLGELLQDTLRLIETDARSSGVSPFLEITPDLLPIAVDRDRMSQVFINLLLNSLQAMEEGGELKVSAVNGPGGDTVKVTIRDTGCGIPPENMGQLFYPYFTTKAGGTGIGLAISQKIINDHRGTIRVDSIPGEGTTVRVTLPVFREEEGSAWSGVA